MRLKRSGCGGAFSGAPDVLLEANAGVGGGVDRDEERVVEWADERVAGVARSAAMRRWR